MVYNSNQVNKYRPRLNFFYIANQASNEPLYPKQPFYPPQPLEAPIAPIYPAVGPTGIQAPVYTQPVHSNMPLHQFDSEPQHCIW